eukprot:Rmarinus@m.2030
MEESQTSNRGRLRLIHTISNTKYGKTELVRDEEVGLEYVLKKVPVDDAAFELACAEILKGQPHRHTVNYLDHWEEEGVLCFLTDACMPIAPCQTLADLISCPAWRLMTEKDHLDFFSQLASGLVYVHSHKIIHRDLCPRNIFYSIKWLKLGDYGLATQALGTESHLQGGLYVSPQMLTGGDYTEKSDVFSLGCVFYEMLMGFPPFSFSDEKETEDLLASVKAASFPSFSDAFSPHLCGLLFQMLSYDEAARPTSTEVLAYLQYLQSLDSGPLPPPTASSRSAAGHHDETITPQCGSELAPSSAKKPTVVISEAPVFSVSQGSCPSEDSSLTPLVQAPSPKVETLLCLGEDDFTMTRLEVAKSIIEDLASEETEWRIDACDLAHGFAIAVKNECTAGVLPVGDIVSSLVAAAESEEPALQLSALRAIAAWAADENNHVALSKTALSKIIVGLLGEENEKARALAVEIIDDLAVSESIIRYGSRSGAISRLLAALEETDVHVRKKACCAVAKLVPLEENRKKVIGGGGVKRLVALLADEDHLIRAYAASAISFIAAEERARNMMLKGHIIPKLTTLLGDENSYVRSSAAFALSAFAINETSVVDIIQCCGSCKPIAKMLSDRCVDVKEAAASLLCRLSEYDDVCILLASDGVIPLLLNPLTDRIEGVRLPAATTLENICKCSDKGVRSLLTQLAEKRLSMFRSADPSQVGTKKACALVLKALVPCNECCSAIVAAGVFPFILELLRGSNQVLVEACVSLFASLASKASKQKNLRSELSRSLNRSIDLTNKHVEARMDATCVLRHLTSDVNCLDIVLKRENMVPSLVGLLGDKHTVVRENSVATIRNIACKDDNRGLLARAHCFSGLVAVLQDEAKTLRHLAVAALAEIVKAPTARALCVDSGVIAHAFPLLSCDDASARSDTSALLMRLSWEVSAFAPLWESRAILWQSLGSLLKDTLMAVRQNSIEIVLQLSLSKMRTDELPQDVIEMLIASLTDRCVTLNVLRILYQLLKTGESSELFASKTQKLLQTLLQIISDTYEAGGEATAHVRYLAASLLPLLDYGMFSSSVLVSAKDTCVCQGACECKDTLQPRGLLEMLRDANVYTRKASAVALASLAAAGLVKEISTCDPAALGTLVCLLKDTSATVRGNVSVVLGLCAQDGGLRSQLEALDTSQKLSDLLCDDVDGVRKRATAALCQFVVRPDAVSIDLILHMLKIDDHCLLSVLLGNVARVLASGGHMDAFSAEPFVDTILGNFQQALHFVQSHDDIGVCDCTSTHDADWNCQQREGFPQWLEGGRKGDVNSDSCPNDNTSVLQTLSHVKAPPPSASSSQLYSCDHFERHGDKQRHGMSIMASLNGKCRCGCQACAGKNVVWAVLTILKSLCATEKGRDVLVACHQITCLYKFLPTASDATLLCHLDVLLQLFERDYQLFSSTSRPPSPHSHAPTRYSSLCENLLPLCTHSSSVVKQKTASLLKIIVQTDPFVFSSEGVSVAISLLSDQSPSLQAHACSIVNDLSAQGAHQPALVAAIARLAYLIGMYDRESDERSRLAAATLVNLSWSADYDVRGALSTLTDAALDVVESFVASVASVTPTPTPQDASHVSLSAGEEKAKSTASVDAATRVLSVLSTCGIGLVGVSRVSSIKSLVGILTMEPTSVTRANVLEIFKMIAAGDNEDVMAENDVIPGLVSILKSNDPKLNANVIEILSTFKSERHLQLVRSQGITEELLEISQDPRGDCAVCKAAESLLSKLLATKTR